LLDLTLHFFNRELHENLIFLKCLLSFASDRWFQDHVLALLRVFRAILAPNTTFGFILFAVFYVFFAVKHYKPTKLRQSWKTYWKFLLQQCMATVLGYE